MTESTPIVDKIDSLHFQGNILPPVWLKVLGKRGKGTAVIDAVILSDLVYWYRKQEIRDESTGLVTARVKRFQADMLQRSSAALAEQLGLTKRQVIDAVKRLKDAGYVLQELRTVTTRDGLVLPNTQFLAPVPDAIARLNEGTPESDYDVQLRTTSPGKTHDLPRKNARRTPEKGDTLQETTTRDLDNRVLADASASAHEHGENSLPSSPAVPTGSESDRGTSTPPFRSAPLPQDDAPEATQNAPESANPAQTPGAPSKPSLADYRAVLDHIRKVQHIEKDWTNYPAQMKAVKQLFQAGYSVEELTVMAEVMVKDTFWREKGFSAINMASQAHRYAKKVEDELDEPPMNAFEIKEMERRKLYAWAKEIDEANGHV